MMYKQGDVGQAATPRRRASVVWASSSAASVWPGIIGLPQRRLAVTILVHPGRRQPSASSVITGPTALRGKASEVGKEGLRAAVMRGCGRLSGGRLVTGSTSQRGTSAEHPGRRKNGSAVTRRDCASRLIWERRRANTTYDTRSLGEGRLPEAHYRLSHASCSECQSLSVREVSQRPACPSPCRQRVSREDPRL